jgi:hypothetical protein
MKEQEKTMLFALTTQVRLTLGDMKGETREKLGSLGKHLESRSRVHVGFYCLSLPFDML